MDLKQAEIGFVIMELLRTEENVHPLVGYRSTADNAQVIIS